MAGAWPSSCCKGCSSTSCTCGGDKGKWGDSSLLGRRLSEDSSRHQLLQKWANMWNSVSGNASVGCAEGKRREEAAEPAEEEDRPLVFLCSGCRRPLGDSMSWVTSQEDTNCILLRCRLPRLGGKLGWGGEGVGKSLGPPSSQACLTWIARQENARGFWGCLGFLKAENSEKVRCPRKRGEGGSPLHLGLTSDGSFNGVPPAQKSSDSIGVFMSIAQ